jgi:hypothetical protein
MKRRRLLPQCLQNTPGRRVPPPPVQAWRAAAALRRGWTPRRRRSWCGRDPRSSCSTFRSAPSSESTPRSVRFSRQQPSQRCSCVRQTVWRGFRLSLLPVLLRQVFSVGPKFKGMKMVPPGPHFVYYCSSSRYQYELLLASNYNPHFLQHVD